MFQTLHLVWAPPLLLVSTMRCIAGLLKGSVSVTAEREFCSIFPQVESKVATGYHFPQAPAVSTVILCTSSKLVWSLGSLFLNL